MMLHQFGRVFFRVVERHVDDIHHAHIGSHCDDDNREYQTHTKYRDEYTHSQENHFPKLIPRFEYRGINHGIVKRQRDFHHCQNKGDK